MITTVLTGGAGFNGSRTLLPLATSSPALLPLSLPPLLLLALEMGASESEPESELAGLALCGRRGVLSLISLGSSGNVSLTSSTQQDGAGALGQPHVMAERSMSDCSSGNTARVIASFGEKTGAPGM